MLTITSAFFLGMLAGALILLLAGLVYGGEISKKEDAALKKSLKDIELMGSVKYRFTKVNEITEQQLNLISRAERPSASAAHSRSKNDIIGQIKALEEEKMVLFRSILKDGIDPKLQMIVDGKPQTILMSEAVAAHDGTIPYPDSKTEPKTVERKLHLIKEPD
jgi:hypothetical protein